MLREKIIAYNSELFVVIGDETKSVKFLGVNAPLPIEIVPEARLSIMKKLEKAVEILIENYRHFHSL